MYISLPSDSSAKYFPDNRISRYTVKLPNELKFERNRFDIGLVACSWPSSFNNVPSTVVETEPVEGTTDRIRIPIEGYYETTQHILLDLNQKINLAQNGATSPSRFPYFFKLTPNGKVNFVSKRSSDPHHVDVGPVLHSKLGFSVGETPSNTVLQTPARGSYYPDLNAGISSIYVYCSVMEPSRILGEEVLPVLRILPVTSPSAGEVVHYQPNNIEYFPLRYDHFSEITIELRDEIGQLVDFNFGKVNIDIHLKRRFL